MSVPDDHQRLDAICRSIATGRSLARQLAIAIRKHQFTEAEFRLLWLLREQTDSSNLLGLGQSALARQLGISPAQVSALVEKLRSRQMILSVVDSSDRRHQRWQLTSLGNSQLASLAEVVSLACHNWNIPESIAQCVRTSQEDAA